MAHIKTAISIEEPVFREAERLAHRKRISRSELFSLAIQEYLNRQESRRIFEDLNKVYDEADPEEELTLKAIRKQQRKTLRGQWK